MADVTISSLPLGTPSGNVSIPYSDGNTTYKTSPSAIVAASTGTTLQVVQSAFTNFQHQTTSKAFVNTGLQAIITPRFTTSKILISINSQGAPRDGGGGYNNFGFYGISRNDTPIYTWGAINNIGWCPINCQYLDAPNTISPVTYKVQSKVGNASNGTLYIGWGNYDTSTSSHVILTEIAG